ncbi:ParM/StbA family protein [Romboutsia sp. 1001216sp1]|uniref:ParM/StbA family protein n=1 Tax=unclassified Romboutsia TaxID=2626894 RepID=UPI00189F78A1|nr:MULTISPECIES: ParM/StbA family protein [unclassified Romboutsia]MDB8790670.1 ParM/StbA family protein [Romboutsia sp. 1001216sp1]MDB8803233.1 ParM/StbA family protein [Romboutsia sp. 1001216sp1]MDB8814603.1 ParM/StbA family protein [Romboutsia sp. 1001216sp1]
MISIVSIDVGNITTIGVSEDKDIIVESRIKEWSNLDELGENEVIEFEGKKYVVEQGQFENNLVKHEKENFLPLMFYTIAKVTDEERVKLVIGIPAGQYNTRKDELKEFIKENNFRKIKLGDKTRQIYIEDVLVVPESYGLKANGVMAQCEKGLKTLVVDIGGGTTDIAEFNELGKFIDGESIKYGLLDLYRNARKVLGNKPYNLDIDLADAKKYFDGELNLLNKDTSYKKDIMLQCIKMIVNELRGLYPNLSNTNIILTGGGAEKVYPTFRKLYEQTIPVTDIKANAKGFYKIGAKAWLEK